MEIGSENVNKNKRTNDDLRMLQALPLEIKEKMSITRIRAWVHEYGESGVYVSRSGGKDSDVLGHLVKSMYPNVKQVFVNTGLEYDSVRKHAENECDVVLRPEMNFVEVVTKYGYPIISKDVADCVSGAKKSIEKGIDSYRLKRINGTLTDDQGRKSLFNCEKYNFLLNAPFKISEKCCDVMKKKPSKKFEKVQDSHPFLGLMASESMKRKNGWIKTGCNAFDKERPQSQPLSFWTEQDILQYIKKYDLEIAEIYGDIIYTDEMGYEYDDDVFNQGMHLETTGVNRTGCVFCMFGITQDKERFLKLKEAEPKKYDYVMRGGKFDDQGMWIPHNGLGYKFVIDWLNEHGNLGIKY